ncbi:MAG: hypothetical protein LBO65_10180 [Spirochaetaceae bacterium]|jgi:hypothetical protein|nr:hypothetical protein [Spirochaetaceae bacterium]
MKRIICCVFVVAALTSCGPKPVPTVFESSTPEEKWAILRDDYLAADAPVSSERPLPNVLSEQEVLLKAADAAIAEGVLYSDYYAYEETPALKTAKIETPILLTDGATGEPNMYLLTAVDDAGVLLAEVYVNSEAGTSDADFELGRGFAITNTSFHYITKREAAELIQSQFPEGEVSEPMAVSNLRLGEDPHSHRGIFWYFTVGESEPSRSAAGTAEEYVLAADVFGYHPVPGGLSNNRAAIDIGQGGSFHLDGYRMAKLDRPLRLFNKLNTARSAGGASFSPSVYPSETISFTPVPLK